MSFVDQSVVMVVESNRDVGETLCLVLRAMGLRPFWVAAARDATETALLFQPFLVLFDVNSADLSGIAVCERLRTVMTETRFVAVTTSRDDDIEAYCHKAGFEVLFKPFPASVLARFVKPVRLGPKRIVLDNLTISHPVSAAAPS